MESKTVYNKNMVKKAYAYLRVSSEEQVTNFSLDNQKDYCLREATRQGYDIMKIYREEGVSAKTLNRPELLKLLEDCRVNQKEISTVFIYRFDRISRETYDFLAIKKKLAQYGIRIISVTEPTENSPTGEFLETLLAASAKLDNATKSLRSLDGMRKRLESGLANGKATVGYLNANKIIVPDEVQFELVKKSWEEMDTGIYTLESIIPVMQKLGIKIRYGGRLIPITRSQQTQRIFRDKFYAGYVVTKTFGIDKIGNHTQMIDEDLFYRVQGILDGRSRTSGIKYQRQNPMFPLRSQVLCGKCGKPLTGAITRKKNGLMFPYYYCSSSDHYSPVVNKDKFEGEYLQFMSVAEPKKELVALFSEMVREKWESRYSHLASQQNTIDQEIEDLHEVRRKLGQKHLQGIYSDEMFQEQLQMIEDQILVKKTIKSEAKLQEIDIDILVNFMNNFLWNIDKAWQEGTMEERKLLTGSIYPEKLTYQYPGFRTTRLGCSFNLIKQFEGTNPSLWVLNDEFLEPIIQEMTILYKVFGHKNYTFATV